MKASETLRAPAKLNLTLEVLARRPDGLHGLRSVMVPVDLFDELEIRRTECGFTFRCDSSELAAQENIVERAVRALALPGSGVEITLRKTIPTAAGMGGGSSDAAAVLLAAQRGSFGAGLHADYLSLARSLGSDVPFFLVETAALVEGTGERVTALGPVPPWHAIVVKPPVAVSTAWAYERIDASAQPTRPRNTSVSIQMCEALQRGEFVRAVELAQNDFHDAILPLVPEIRTATDALREAGAIKPMLTGSGSCVFSLIRSVDERESIAERLRLPVSYRVFTCSFWNGGAWRAA